jgi:hypothetical protein
MKVALSIKRRDTGIFRSYIDTLYLGYLIGKRVSEVEILEQMSKKEKP